MFTTLLLTIALLDQPRQDRPKPPPGPRQSVNRPQPRGYKPYWHRDTKPDPQYHRQHGHRFKHGHYYRGHSHRHWSHHQWSPAYGCWIYYDEGPKCWYYWNREYHCYFPVTYLPKGSRYDHPYEESPRPPKVLPPVDDDK